MYCTNCHCEFEGWKGDCPQCNTPLLEVPPEVQIFDERPLAYETLTKMISDQGGQVDIDLNAVEISKSKSTRFPYMGFGYAWTHRMYGEKEGISVDLSTTKVRKDRKRTFPYKGHGFAWREEMQGSISGNEVSLNSIKVNRKKTWSFPYSGFGYAWTEDMTGTCGQDIKVELKTTRIKKIRRWAFPYFGYGYAWVKEGVLSLILVN